MGGFGRSNRKRADDSPLLAQRRLNFTDPDEGAQVFELSAVLRHAYAAHGVSLLAESGRLWGDGGKLKWGGAKKEGGEVCGGH